MISETEIEQKLLNTDSDRENIWKTLFLMTDLFSKTCMFERNPSEN